MNFQGGRSPLFLSWERSNFYKGPAISGGQFSILTEAAEEPQADAFLARRGWVAAFNEANAKTDCRNGR
jgi:hypothetical protein